MNTLLIIFIAALILFIGYRILSSTDERIESISTEDLKGTFKKKETQWIDVRTPAEYKANHIKKFKNIPLHELAARTQELDAGKETYVICQSGMRSRKAAGILKKKGFEQVINVKGGMGSYRS